MWLAPQPKRTKEDVQIGQIVVQALQDRNMQKVSADEPRWEAVRADTWD